MNLTLAGLGALLAENKLTMRVTFDVAEQLFDVSLMSLDGRSIVQAQGADLERAVGEAVSRMLREGQ